MWCKALDSTVKLYEKQNQKNPILNYIHLISLHQ